MSVTRHLQPLHVPASPESPAVAIVSPHQDSNKGSHCTSTESHLLILPAPSANNEGVTRALAPKSVAILRTAVRIVKKEVKWFILFPRS